MQYTQLGSSGLTVSRLAERHEVPVAHVAYAWLLAKPQVSGVIVGASRPDQVAGNLAAAEFSLTGRSSPCHILPGGCVSGV